MYRCSRDPAFLITAKTKRFIMWTRKTRVPILKWLRKRSGRSIGCLLKENPWLILTVEFTVIFHSCYAGRNLYVKVIKSPLWFSSWFVRSLIIFVFTTHALYLFIIKRMINRYMRNNRKEFEKRKREKETLEIFLW